MGNETLQAFDQEENFQTDLQTFLQHRQQQKGGNDVLGLAQKLQLKISEKQGPVPVAKFLSENVLQITIDADGDQVENELELTFTRNLNFVAIAAKHNPSGTSESYVGSFTISNNPELFFVWNQIPATGKEPYRMYLSLSANGRTFLNEYQNYTQGGLYERLANTIKNEGSVYEKVIDGGIHPNIGVGYSNHKDFVVTPWDEVFRSGQDELKIYHEVSNGGITYAFKVGEKPIGEFFVDKHTASKPLVEVKKTPKVEKKKEDLTPSEPTHKFGTFTIPLKAGRDENLSKHYYQLLVIPDQEKGKAKISVSLADPHDQVSWAGTFKVDVPVVKNGVLDYAPEVHSDHVAITFFPKGSTPKKDQKSDLQIYFQAFNNKFENLKKGSQSNFLKMLQQPLHRTESLWIYYKSGDQEKHEKFTTYYQAGRRKGARVMADEDIFEQQVVQDARRRTPKTLGDKHDINETRGHLEFQELGFMMGVWKKPDKPPKLLINQPPLKYIDAAEEFRQFLFMLKALHSVNTLIQTKAIATTPYEVFRLKAAAEMVARFEGVVRKALGALTPGEKKGASLTEPLLSKMLATTNKDLFRQINLEKKIREYEEIMLTLTKGMMKRNLDPKENSVVRKYKKQGIDELGNRRKNFDTFIKEKEVSEDTELMKVSAYFYPNKDWYKGVKGKAGYAVRNFMESKDLPRFEVPLYVYRKGDYWHVVSFFSRTMDTYFRDKYEMKTEEERSKYATSPPIELFKLLDRKDHLPKGWLIYDLPGDVPTRAIKMNEKMEAEDYLNWIGMALLAAGIIAFTAGTGALAGGLFFVAGLAGGAGATIQLLRKGENGSLTGEEKILAFVDIASAIIGVLGPLTNAIGKMGSAASQITAKTGAIVQFTLNTLDVTIDTGVLVYMGTKHAEQITDIINGPGTLAEKTNALAKLIPLLMMQYGMFIVTVPKRVSRKPGKVLKKLMDQWGGRMSMASGDSITIKNNPLMYKLISNGWDEGLLKKIYHEVGEYNFNKKFSDLNQLNPKEIKAYKQLYGEDNLMYAIYTHGNIHQARKQLDAHFDYRNSQQMYDQIRAADNPQLAREVTGRGNFKTAMEGKAGKAKTELEGQIKEVNRLRGVETSKQKGITDAQNALGDAKGAKKQTEIDIKDNKNEIAQRETEVKRIHQETEVLKGDRTEIIEWRVNDWSKELKSRQELLAAQRQKWKTDQETVKDYNDNFEKAYKAYDAKVKAKQESRKARAKKWKAKKMKKATTDEAKDKIEGYYENRLRGYQQKADRKMSRFEYKDKTYQENKDYIAQQQRKVNAQKQRIKFTEKFIETYQKSIKNGQDLLRLRGELKPLHQKRTQLKQDLQSNKTAITTAEQNLQKAHHDLKVAQNDLKTAEKMKRQKAGAHQRAQKIADDAKANYQKVKSKYDGLVGKAQQAREKGRATQQRKGNIERRYNTATQLVRAIDKAGTVAADKDVYKALWNIAKTLLTLLPGMTPESPEYQANINAMQDYLLGLERLLRTKMLYNFGTRQLKLAEKAKNTAHGLQLIQQQIKGIKNTPDKRALEMLQPLIKQLAEAQWEIEQAQQTLKNKK